MVHMTISGAAASMDRIPSRRDDTLLVSTESERQPCLHHLIEAQAVRTPDQPALAFEQQRLTYRELDRRADQVAYHLERLGVGPDVLVGLFVERSVDMIVGILGILKAGGAYVPIDTAYPRERIAFMLADAHVSILLTHTLLHADRPALVEQVVCLDSFDWANAAASGRSDRVRPNNLAYVIYTSGSTGQPKGVCIEHRNIVNYVRGVAERLQLEPGMHHATVSTIAADLGNTVLFPALATGGCLHVISQERTENQAKLSEYFTRERIDVLKIVPSHLAVLQTGRNPEQVMPRRRLILGGESSRLDWVQQLQLLSPNCQIFNHYGPTETTVGVLTYPVGRQLPATQSGTLPLGSPLPNSRVYILDEHGQPTPVGTQGELCIGGYGVARGYLNRADLTAERFVPDPFSPDSDGRLYRTGDLARYLPDGNIEFCGRIDHQVKMHGYRIELGEIEQALRTHPGVRDAVVLASEDESGSKQLTAYVVPTRPGQALWDHSAIHLLPDGLPVAHLNKNETDYIYNEIFTLQAYLRHGISIHDGDCIVDAGANIGLFMLFASRLARDLRITCFEPNPAAFACLKANAEAWGSGVKCLPFGLSSENGSAELTFFEGLSLLSGFYADPAKEREVVKNYVLNQESGPSDNEFAEQVSVLIDGRLRARTERAELRTLSNVIAEEGLDRIDLLKVNVEKSELDVLRGLKEEDWAKIRQLVIEVDLRENVTPITAMLEAHGYDVLVEQDPLLKKTELCYVYAIRPSATRERLIRQQSAGSHIQPLPPPNKEVLTPATLRTHLRERLPLYMIPSAFVLMEQFPLTSNGKIDQQALPALSGERRQPARREFVRPNTETEKALAAIWTELLKVENIGIGDDFFDLGGHSLLAIKAVSRIRDVFGVDLQTQTLFDHATIADLARVVAGATRTNGKHRQIERRAKDGPCGLSFAQEQLWFLNQLAPGSPAYNIVDVVLVSGKYNANAMREAMNELVRRHEILRTVFPASNGEPMQIVLPAMELSLAERDLGSLPVERREHEWGRIVREQGRRPFDLSKAPLIRGTVVHVSDREHKLLLTVHHILADEWSMELIQHEVTQLYEAFTQQRRPRLPDLSIQYADFAYWQRTSLRGAVLERQKSYWRQELAGASPVLELPTDKPRPAVQSFRGATEFFELPNTLSEQLKALSRQEQATLFMVLEAGFATLLHRYTGQPDVLVGTPITGRTHSETEALIGCFLNTIVMRARFGDRLSFRSLLRQVRERALAAYAHPDLPFEHLVAEVATDRDPGRTPLFQVMFVMHDTGGVSQVSKVSGNRELETGTSKFDLTLFMSETGGHLEGMIEYSTDLFEAPTIRRLCRYYRTVLEAVVSDPDRPVATLPMLSEGEREERRNWNATGRAISATTVDKLISRQAQHTPERAAVEFQGKVLNYGELERQSTRLADRLRVRGVGPGRRVGIFMDRSLDMVVGLLGVLKTGGAYVPLDPAFPGERLRYMLEDSGASVLLTHAAVAQAVPSQAIPIVRVDVEDPEPAASVPNEPRRAGPEDLAYVIYTSGSTGRPKGVAVTHRSLVNLLESMGREPGFREQDVLLSVTTLSFDIAALELYLPLLRGGRIALASREETVDGRRLIKRLSSSGATVMQATPATWRMLLESGWDARPGLKVLCGGEALPRDLAEELLRRADEVWNMYGPTETTVWSSACRVASGQGAVSIGRPIANTQMWILDAHLQPLPVGVPGEMYIGGTGVAQGYWKRPELTAERFIPDPFSDTPGAKLYRTGDIARWLPDGRLECLGRQDHQVKVRGFRIELGEIEAGLRELPGVEEAVVLAQETAGDERRLVAYVASGAGTAPDAASLRSHLASKVPAYMVPSSFVFPDALPLTPNGKVDRKALAKMEAGVETHHAEKAAPRSATEETIASIWTEVLDVPSLGRDENFFDAGGHSLNAARIIARVSAAFGVDLELKNLFERPTIAGLAEIVDLLVLSQHPDSREMMPRAREEFEI